MVKTDRLYEMVYDKGQSKTEFAYIDPEKGISYTKEVEETSEVAYVPYLPGANLLHTDLVLFPSKAEEYGNDEELVKDIRAFVDPILEVSDFMREIIPYYVLLTWIYDDFHELPYLRVLGDYGTGKSRFLKAVGSISYKPIFSISATSEASIFRLIDQLKGTLVIDEADLSHSNADNTLVQILNSGYQKGFPIHRCIEGKGKFDVVSFQVFGPKIIAGRHPFNDPALESRCIVEKMGIMKRSNIPTNLTEEFNANALTLRNKLLLWRLRNHGKRTGKNFTDDLTIEPRLKQIIFPLSAVIENKDTIESLKMHIKVYNQELITDRGFTTESIILETIIILLRNCEEITLKQIMDAYDQTRLGDKKMNAKKLGYILRKKLGLKTYRKNIGYILDIEHAENIIPQLCIKYGIDSEQMNEMNDIGRDLADMNLF